MITIVSGLPGAGKSYFLASEGLAAIRKGRPVFSVFPLRFAYKLELDWLEKFIFPEDSLLVLDEAQLFYNARLWQQMKPEVMRYYAQHRHNGVDVLFAAQHPARLDAALRDIAGEFVWLTSWGPIRRRAVDRVDPITGEVSRGVRIEKRAVVMRGEVVGSYDAWGAIKAQDMDKGYRRWWTFVRPSVFRMFDSYDMSQLAGRDLAPVTEWYPEDRRRRGALARLRGWLRRVWHKD